MPRFYSYIMHQRTRITGSLRALTVQGPQAARAEGLAPHHPAVEQLVFYPKHSADDRVAFYQLAVLVDAFPSAELGGQGRAARRRGDDAVHQAPADEEALERVHARGAGRDAAIP